MRIYIFYITFLALPVLIAGCKKDPGEGGKATIKGHVKGNYYCDDSGELLETSAANEHRVYISYGDNSAFDDDARTSATGEYQFRYLHPGNYTLTTFSECNKCPTGNKVITQQVEVGKRDRDVTAAQFEVDNYSGRACPTDTTEGYAEAIGYLKAIYVDENNWDTLGSEKLANERVFISRSYEKTHFDDVRTSSDGSFRFRELPLGNFQIYAYSECLTCLSGEEAQYRTFSISEPYQRISIDTLKVVIYRNR